MISAAGQNNATGEQMRILDGLFDHVLRMMNASHLHRQSCPGGDCVACAATLERERQARAAYDAELRKVFG